MTHQEYREMRDEIQRQCWQASIVNRDNPLSHNLLDAHFAAMDRLFLDAVGEDDNDFRIDNSEAEVCEFSRNQLRKQLRTTITGREGGE